MAETGGHAARGFDITPGVESALLLVLLGGSLLVRRRRRNAAAYVGSVCVG